MKEQSSFIFSDSQEINKSGGETDSESDVGNGGESLTDTNTSNIDHVIQHETGQDGQQSNSESGARNAEEEQDSEHDIGGHSTGTDAIVDDEDDSGNGSESEKKEIESVEEKQDSEHDSGGHSTGTDAIIDDEDDSGNGSESEKKEIKTSGKKSRGRPPKKRTHLSLEKAKDIHEFFKEKISEDHAREKARRDDDGRLKDKNKKVKEERCILLAIYTAARILRSYDMIDVIRELFSNVQVAQRGDRMLLDRFRYGLKKSGDKERFKLFTRDSQATRAVNKMADEVKQNKQYTALSPSVDADGIADKTVNEIIRDEYTTEVEKRDADGQLLNDSKRQVEEEMILFAIYRAAEILKSCDMMSVIETLFKSVQMETDGNKTLLDAFKNRLDESDDEEFKRFFTQDSPIIKAKKKRIEEIEEYAANALHYQELIRESNSKKAKQQREQAKIKKRNQKEETNE